MQMNNEPWEHGVIDNFYDETLFSAMKKEIISYIRNMKSFQPKMTIRTSDVDFEKIFPESLKCLNSRPIDETYLSMFSEHRPYKKLSHYSEINILLGELEYPIHDELHSKIMSVVTYVSPEKSIGTVLYDEDKNFSKEIDWLPNRTLIFCGKTGVTWHNYRSLPNSLRITINTFLIDGK